MPTEIVMNEQEIQLREIKTLNTITYNEMISSMNKLIGQPPTFYPLGLSFSSIMKDGDQKEIYVITQSPGVHPFRYRGNAFTSDKEKKLKEKTFHISLPYMHVISSWIKDAQRSMKMFFTQEPLMNMDTPIQAPILPNLHHDYHICTGGDFVMPNKELPNPFRTKHILDFYMDADHNDDFDEFIRNKLFENFEEWQEASLKNPSLWHTLNLKSGMFKTFKDILGSM